jgi:hypothetical protein
VRGEHSSDELIFSKTCQCLDGEVTRTAVLIFEALDEAEQRNSPQSAVASALLKWLPRVPVVPWLVNLVRRISIAHTPPGANQLLVEIPGLAALKIPLG